MKIGSLCTVLAACIACSSQPQKEQQKLGPYEKQDDDTPTVVGYDHYSDPIEPVNRALFKFNDVFYRYLLTPISKGYVAVMPEPASQGLTNFFKNLREPLFSLNNLFQGNFTESGTSLLRLGINSTVGLLGFFDPADAWLGMERKKTTFGRTLAKYGVGYGAYFVIPVLGPSNVRDGATMAFEYYSHPVNYIADRPNSTYYFITEGFHEMAPTLKDYPAVIKDTEDKYEFVRNLYLQRLMRDDEHIRRKTQSEQEATSLYEEAQLSTDEENTQPSESESQNNDE